MTVASSGRRQQRLMYIVCVEREGTARVRPSDKQCIDQLACYVVSLLCSINSLRACSQRICWTPLPASLAPRAPSCSHSSCQGPHLGRALCGLSLWRSGKAAMCGVHGKICSTCRRCRTGLEASHSDDICRRQWSRSFDVSSLATSTCFELVGTTLDMLRHVTILSKFAVLLSSPTQAL